MVQCFDLCVLLVVSFLAERLTCFDFRPAQRVLLPVVPRPFMSNTTSQGPGRMTLPLKMLEKAHLVTVLAIDYQFQMRSLWVGVGFLKLVGSPTTITLTT